MVLTESKNLDTTCYRGDATLAHLALLSQPDVYDQVSNPEGLQRDLSPKHASDAYDYVKRPPDPKYPRAYPELVVNVRDKKVIKLEPIAGMPEGCAPQYRLTFDLKKMESGNVFVSRTDGNHRLEHAAGDDRREPLLASVPVQVHIGLTRDQERSLFVDINANQKGFMQSKMTPEQQEIRDHLDRWIAKRLTDDPTSPWHGIVHMGGSKKGSRAQGLPRAVNFGSLQTGVARILSKSQYIHDLTEPHAQYAIIRNYWLAVKTVFAEEWAAPKQYLLLKNIGVLSFSILGGTIIERCLAHGKFEVKEFAHYLEQVRGRFNWSAHASGDGAVSGMSGNRAALIIAGEMAAQLSDETGASLIKGLQQKLLDSGPTA
jgi:DGQHR domain-containing protein